jgi:UDP-N-acetylmuramoylalanine--D-glutamate ligase
MDLTGAKYSVLGLARTGIAAANYLARHGANVVASDMKDIFDLPLDDLHSAIDVRSSQNFVRENDCVVISPGIRPHSSAWNLAHEKGGEVISDIELFARLCPCPIIAITGTDGKSTTTALIGHLLEAAGIHTFVGGNIGHACMNGLDDLTPESVAVLEVSCFQLTHCRTFKPAVAVVTNIAEDHVEYHGSMSSYIEAKQRIYAHQGEGDRLIINGEDPEIAGWEFPADVEIRKFGWDSSFDAWADSEHAYLPADVRIAHPDLLLKGLHNVENVLAAALATAEFFPAIAEMVKSFPGLEHRMEYVETINDVVWYNDSKATNPHATAAVVSAFGDTRFWLLAGGSDKGSDFTDLGKLIGERTQGVVLYGQTRDRLAAVIPAGHPMVLVETLTDAVRSAASQAGPGEMVVLAPACASFDQFQDYEQRGRVFKDLVRRLKSSAGTEE